jgi:hypothetical protein
MLSVQTNCKSPIRSLTNPGKEGREKRGEQGGSVELVRNSMSALAMIHLSRYYITQLPNPRRLAYDPIARRALCHPEVREGSAERSVVLRTNDLLMDS